ncbi:hypothetical protein [Cryptosporangium aurantiacum]|uniref:hypothetical protein n=1 Tax=Cryptosporangium aurantiacum TaxID=134849 RepID=UPI00116128B1|nr:hypothetical protein [Cryptosporangium aurantiacum]
MTLPVLTVVTDGDDWEAALVAAWGSGSSGITVVRRCTGAADLLAVAATGVAVAAVVPADLVHLDRPLLTRLSASGVAIVGLVDPDDGAARDRLRTLGIAHVLPTGATPAAVAEALRAAAAALAHHRTPPGRAPEPPPQPWPVRAPGHGTPPPARPRLTGRATPEDNDPRRPDPSSHRPGSTAPHGARPSAGPHPGADPGGGVHPPTGSGPDSGVHPPPRLGPGGGAGAGGGARPPAGSGPGGARAVGGPSPGLAGRSAPPARPNPAPRPDPAVRPAPAARPNPGARPEPAARPGPGARPEPGTVPAIRPTSDIVSTRDRKDPNPQVLAVWGPTGAPGRTTIAVGLADEAARLGVPTLLVDADTYGGVVAQHLGLLDEASGLASAARLADTGRLDARTLATLARTVTPHLRVLTGISRAERWPEIGPDAMTELLRQARALTTLTVVDCGFSLEQDEELVYDTAAPRRNGATLAALEAADTVLAVGTADPVGLQRLIRGLASLREVAPILEPQVVVNRLRRGPIVGDPAREVTTALQRFAGVDGARTLPYDRPAVDRALAEGRTLAEVAEKSQLRRALAELALAFCSGSVQDRS